MNPDTVTLTVDLIAVAKAGICSMFVCLMIAAWLDVDTGPRGGGDEWF